MINLAMAAAFRRDCALSGNPELYTLKLFLHPGLLRRPSTAETAALLAATLTQTCKTECAASDDSQRYRT